MKAYRSPDGGLRDVLRLSQAMTMKQAAAGLAFGGGKAVLAVPDGARAGIVATTRPAAAVRGPRGVARRHLRDGRRHEHG